MDLIGAMYHVVAVQTNAGGAMGAGGVDNYTTLLQTRCALDTSSGGRNSAYAEITGGVSAKITTRYQDALWSAVSMSMKFIIDGVTYTMQGWERKKDNRREYIVFKVTTERNG